MLCLQQQQHTKPINSSTSGGVESQQIISVPLVKHSFFYVRVTKGVFDDGVQSARERKHFHTLWLIDRLLIGPLRVGCLRNLPLMRQLM